MSDSTPDVESARQHFEVDALSGELLLREPLDYESRTRYRLVVGARDRGESPRSSETAIGVLGAHTHLFDQNKSITKSRASYPFKILLVFSMRSGLSDTPTIRTSLLLQFLVIRRFAYKQRPKNTFVGRSDKIYLRNWYR